METALGCLLHEIQHALQDIEGFAQGGSVRLMELAGEKTPRTDFLYGMEKWNRWMRSIGYPDEKLMDPFADIAFNTEDVILSDLEVQGMWLAWRAKLPEHIIEEQMVRAFGESSPYKLSVFDSEPAYEQYRRLAGEVEARNVETRRSLTDVQRMGLSPAVTQDVRAKDIIISFNGNDVQRVSGKADQTQTEAFKRWFARSKVVDTEGRPLRVYHGTTGDVAAFDLAYSGSDGVAYGTPAIFATDDPLVASDYAKNKRNRTTADASRQFQRYKNEHPGDYGEDYERLFDAYKAAGRKEGWDTGGGGNVLPLYLSLQNPLEVDGGGGRFMQVMPQAIEQARAQGHDGLIVRAVIDHASPASEYPVTVYVAFHPEQIKSAIGNNGTFNPADPDIRFSFAAPAAMLEQDASGESEEAVCQKP